MDKDVYHCTEMLTDQDNIVIDTISGAKGAVEKNLTDNRNVVVKSPQTTFDTVTI